MIKEFSLSENKEWAVILGGSSGLGLATAKKLAKHGMNICIVHRDRKSNLPAFDKQVEDIRTLGVEVITFNKDALSATYREEIISNLREKSVKVLIHSIAKGSLKPLNGNTDEVLNKTDLDNNRQAFTSEGNLKVWPGYAAVSAAKTVLESLMRAMAVELAPLNITTNCIQAGTTQTPSFAMIPGSEKLAEMALKRNPMQRLTTPEDVANAVYLLCKNEANWINGTILKVDGGESLR